MATKKNPTNADIYLLLGELKQEVSNIHDQVLLTNGRVGRLERWRESLDTIENYKEKHPSQTKFGLLTPLEKKLVGIIMALIALAGSAIAAGRIN